MGRFFFLPLPDALAMSGPRQPAVARGNLLDRGSAPSPGWAAALPESEKLVDGHSDVPCDLA
jgi:hypothetical protein